MFLSLFKRPRTHIRLCCVAWLTLVLVIFWTFVPLEAKAQADSETRVALVVGNGSYQNVPALKNPSNDAEDLASALENIGFEVVLHIDQSQSDMLDVLRTFRRMANGADIALIYFAGHGIEIDRQNYLIPVDAVLETDSDINFEAVQLETMIFAASGARKLSMVIVDACRNNPFATSIQRTSSSRSIGRGLSAVEPSKNTLVAYAAKEGTTAADGAGRNSPYAKALVNALKSPDLEVGLMMRRVRDQVLQETQGQQEPFVYGSLSADQIYFNDTRGLSIVAGNDATPSTESIAISQGSSSMAAEIAFWQSAERSDDPAELRSYLSRYPDGLFAELAQSRLQRSTQASLPEINRQSDTGLKPLVPDAEPLPLQDRELARDEVVELQERLSVLGFSLGRADGIPGRRTTSAIQAFEKDANRPITGLATFSVLTALREAVSDENLLSWRTSESEKAAAAKRSSQAKPAATQPKPAPAKTPVTQSTATETAAEETKQPTAAFRKFCASNKQCATSQCRSSSSLQKQDCRFCKIYQQNCQ